MADADIRALIVAFDDVLMPTHALRAAALRDACAAEGVTLEWSWIIDATRDQQLRAIVTTGLPGTADDPTRNTLIGLRADVLFRQAAVASAALNPDVIAHMEAMASRGGRVIVRADAPREVVSRILGDTPLMDLLAFLVCTDDAGVPHVSAAWQRIDDRLLRVGIAASARAALEARPDARQMATPFVAQLLPWNPLPFIPLRPS